MLPMVSSSSLSASASSSSATVAVDKATSDLLISPDWTMNIDICDSVNSHHWQAKDVVRALKRRLQHKNPKVQMLSLTLLETMVKNCGDYLHFQVAERNVLGEMIKIVKKKVDMQVREKILALLDSWQEAFGGPGGKYPQYYHAYEELRRSGIEFPKRSLDASPIFTPPASHPVMGRPQPGYGMPSNASRRLDETMATEIESLSMSSIEAMWNVSELLGDMLQAVNPSDRAAVKDEIIVELVNRCRTNQKKLMQMLTSTGDEELLARGLELNDCLQSLLARHDAIASGSPLPAQLTSSSPQRTETSVSSVKQSEVVRDSSSQGFSPRPNISPPALATTTSTAITRTQIYGDEEEEEEEDEFAQLARRHTTKPPSSNGIADDLAVVSVTEATESPSSSKELALADPPVPVKTKEQDMIDLLSITLSTTGTSPPPPPAPEQSSQPVPADLRTQAYPQAPQPYTGPQAHVGYVVPWAQQSRPEPPPQLQQPQQPRYSSPYPPPPWAVTPGYYTNQSQTPVNNNGYVAQTNAQAQSNPSSTTGPKPFVPSYRLFEDLNVFGSSSSNGASSSGQSVVGGRK